MLLPEMLASFAVLIPMVISAAVIESPRQKRSVNEYAVEGCFSSFTAGVTKQMEGDNSNVKCQDTCREKGCILAATKGDQCLCGNVYPTGEKMNNSQCTTRCRWWSPCSDPQSCCGGPSAFTVSVVGNIDVAKQVLRRLSHEWQTDIEYRNYMKSRVSKPATGSHNQNWWTSFDREGWSKCGRGRYMTGMYRSAPKENDPIHFLEDARCVDAPGYLYSTEGDRDCYHPNWWGSFDREGWSTCSDGYYMTGLYRSSGKGLSNIEDSNCCRPKSQVKSWGHCYDLDAWQSFDREGWTTCADGYYMAGLYRSACNKLSCLEAFKCCKMGDYNGDSWLEKPDLIIKIKDTSGQLKRCTMNAMDKSSESSTFQCSVISDRSNMLALNALKFNIEDKSPLNVAKPEPVKGFRPVICSARSTPYKCTKWLTTSVSTSSTFKIGSGFTSAVKIGASVEVGAALFGSGTKSTFSKEITKTISLNIEASATKTFTTTDKTDVSVEVPKNSEVTINLLRTVQDLEYKWKAIFELLGKYSAKWTNGQELFQDVTTVLSGSKREMFAFGSWSYPGTDVLRVVITDKYGNEESEGCQHELGKTKKCDL